MVVFVLLSLFCRCCFALPFFCFGLVYFVFLSSFLGLFGHFYQGSGLCLVRVRSPRCGDLIFTRENPGRGSSDRHRGGSARGETDPCRERDEVKRRFSLEFRH